MLLIVSRAGDTGDNSEDCAESVVHAINRVRDPTAATPVPAFALKNRIERAARIWRPSHRIQRARMRFFFQRARAQKFLHVVFLRECAFALGTKLLLVFFFSRFHSTNGDVGTKRAREAALESAPGVVAQLRDRLSHLLQLLLPSRGVPFLRFGHAN